MGIFQLGFKLAATLIGILSKHSDGALELASSELLNINIIFLQQSMKIGHLRNDTNGPQDSKGRG